MSDGSRAGGVWALIDWIGAIGDRPEDPPEERLKHQFLIYMGVLMSGGGVLWGSIAAGFGLYFQATVPYGYVVVTAVNLGVLYVTKNFPLARNVQVMISLLLPFLFQWVLGGFVSSGGVMLWAMLAIVGSLTFSTARQSLIWLGMYSALTLVSGLLDAQLRATFSAAPTMDVSVAFFVTNIVVISGIVFGLTIYLMFRREESNVALQHANHMISEMNEKLEDEVAARTRELRSALAERQAILDNLVDGLVAVDASCVVHVANPALGGMMLIDGDPTGKRCDEALPAGLAEAIRDARTSAAAIHRDIALPGDRTGKVSAARIHDGDVGQGVVALVRDVTLEREIDRMKTDFIATVSHELRTPLTSVLGFAKITKNKLEERVFPHVPADDRQGRRAVDQVRGNVDIIVSEGERLTALINDVLDISKMEAGRMEWKMGPVQVNELLERARDAVGSLFLRSPVQLVLEVEPNLPTIQGDHDRLLQVLINLLSNSGKFTEQGSVTLSARAAPGGVELGVADTGSGIDPALHATIFEKFKQVGDTLTNKPKGTGLGLPICQQIARAHGSEIRVESRLGAGARFSFLVPVERGPATPRPDAERVVRTVHRRLELAEAAGRDILVVDDDANLRELLRQQLTEHGYAVRMATNGYEAIGQVRAKRPDLVILDVMMPELSGFDVAAMLKNDPATESIPILILSIIQDTERGVRLGVDRYMTKPAEAEALVAAVQELVAEVRSPRRVLVVDQDASMASDVARLFEAKGYHVVGTCTGAEALEEARKKLPDLIVVQSLPEGQEDLLQTIQFEKDLAHVYVVQLVGEVLPGQA